MIPGRLHNAAVTTVWRKRNEPGCRISNFPSPTFTRADGWCKKSNFPSLSFARADIWCRILNFPSLFEREQIRKVQNIVQTQRKRGLSPVFAFGKFEILHQTRNPPAQKLPTHTRSALLCRRHEGLSPQCGGAALGVRREAHSYAASTEGPPSRCEETAPKASGAACSPAYTARAKGLSSRCGGRRGNRSALRLMRRPPRRPAARLARRPILPGRRACLLWW